VAVVDAELAQREGALDRARAAVELAESSVRSSPHTALARRVAAARAAQDLLDGHTERGERALVALEAEANGLGPGSEPFRRAAEARARGRR
jgi:hypothetical protein